MKLFYIEKPFSLSLALQSPISMEFFPHSSQCLKTILRPTQLDMLLIN